MIRADHSDPNTLAKIYSRLVGVLVHCVCYLLLDKVPRFLFYFPTLFAVLLSIETVEEHLYLNPRAFSIPES